MTGKQAIMTMFEFTLRLDRQITEDEADELCGVIHDGSVMTGPGRTEIEFTRDAPGWAEAIGSAIRDIECVPGLRVAGVGQADLVSIRDIAHRTRRSREAVRLWAAGKRGPGGFPAPDWQSPSGERFWSWPRVARWVKDSMNLAVEATPCEIRWADEILKARQVMIDVQDMLERADDATRRHLGPLLKSECA